MQTDPDASWFRPHRSLTRADLARSVFLHVRARVSPFKRVRRLEFTDLPKTI